MKKTTLSLCLALGLALLPAGKAHAVALLVQPMRLEAQGRPGETVTLELEVRNTDAAAANEADLLPHEIGQNDTGTFTFSKPEATPKERSCLPWLSFPNSGISIQPLASTKVPVSIKIPQGVRGTYAGALIVRSKPDPRAGNIPVIVQFLVPIIVDVQGASPKKNVEVAGMSLTLDESGEPAVTFTARNSGEAYTGLAGAVEVFATDGDKRRRMAHASLEALNLLPGSSITKTLKLSRRLPPGSYALRANLEMDGKRLRPIEETAELGGAATAAAAEAAQQEEVRLKTETDCIVIDSKPGTQRASTVRLYNEGTSDTDYWLTLSPCRAFAGKTMGAMSDKALDGSKMLEVRPDQGDIKAQRNRNIQLRAALPKDATAYPFHYAQLDIIPLKDGHPAGEALSSLVAIRNVDLQPEWRLTGTAALHKGDGDKQSVTVKFDNVGTAHGALGVAGRITDTLGKKNLKTISFENSPAVMLPLERRTLSADFDLNGVEEGDYALEIVGQIEKTTERISIPVRITGKGADKKLITLGS